MQTKKEDDIEKSPFYGLFERHPWLVPLLTMVNRQLGPFKNFISQEIGILKEFYEVNVKPFDKQ